MQAEPGIERLYATRGVNFQPWLDRLPQVLSQCGKQWKLAVEAPYPELSYNYVAPASREDGTPVVLKLCPPDDHEFLTEVQALKCFDGHGIASLYESDLALGAMLIEQVLPGKALNCGDDVESVDIAIGVMKKLWCPAPAQHDFPTVSEWQEGFVRLRKEFDGGTGPFPVELVEKAETIFSQHGFDGTSCLLHGDMHHANILSSYRDNWLAIDPKGLVGPPVYDAATVLRSPLDKIMQMKNPLPFLQRRLELLSRGLSMDAKLLVSWSFAQAVLSAWWSFEDEEDDWKKGLEGAKIFLALLENLTK